MPDRLRSLTQNLMNYRPLVINVVTLVGTSGVNAALGFFYWVAAAQNFRPAVVGLSSASISAMTLLGTIGMLGLGTLLMGLLPQLQQQRGVYLSTALVTVSVVGLGIGAIFALIARWISPDLAVLSAQPLNLLIFALGVSFTAVTLVLDQALLGLLWGDLQLWRNMVFAGGKLVFLLIAAHFFGSHPMTIYITWLLGNGLSLLLLAGAISLFRRRRLFHRPNFALLRSVGWESVQHHILNILLQAPGLVLPLLVTALFSATTNGYFYIAWMLASLLFTIPFAFATVLYASTAATPEQLAQKLQFTLAASFILGAIGIIALGIGGGLIISFFGSNYVQESRGVVFMLSFAVFGIAIKDHFVAIYRVQRQMRRAFIYIGLGTITEIVFPIVGARFGLSGLIGGWLVSLYLQSIIMARPFLLAIKPTAETALIESNLPT